ncbi:MAG: T9SS type A sorting domain-containing protein, partial [Bacteroidales bacterium]|nr:T9SS type A sorting domain-containing protein [Bacteroidales bacterium]
VVSNHAQEANLFDFSCKTDNDGNCIIAFADIRFGTHDIFVYKISADGQQLWGDDGIRLSNHPEGEYKPALCITAGNNAIVSWTETNAETGDHLIMAAIDEEGSLLWGLGNVDWAPDDDYNYAQPALVATTDGDFILIFSRNTGPGWSVNRCIYAQRLDMHSNTIWPEEAAITILGGMPGWDKLNIKEDDQGGFYVAWNDDRELDNIMESYIQHVNASGDLLFTPNGLIAGSKPVSHKFNPMIAGENNQHEVFIFWKQVNCEREEACLYGQRISEDGIKLWPAYGQEIIPEGTDFYMLTGCDLQDNLSYIFYNTVDPSGEDMRIRAISVDYKGDLAWDMDYLSVSEVPKVVINPDLSEFFEGQWVLVWSDTRAPEYDLYAQNITQEGSIGIPTGIVEPQWRDVLIYPNPCSDWINIDQKGYQRLSISDISGRIITMMEIDTRTISVETNFLTPGFYLLELYGESNFTKLIEVR